MAFRVKEKKDRNIKNDVKEIGDESRKKREKHTISLRKENRSEIYIKHRRQLKPDELKSIPKNLMTSIKNNNLQEVREFIVTCNFPPTRELIDSGYIPILFNYIIKGNEQEQCDAIWILENISESTQTLHTEELLKLGILPILFHIFQQEKINKQILIDSLTILSNIACDGRKFRSYLLDNNLMNYLLLLINKEDEILIELFQCLSGLTVDIKKENAVEQIIFLIQKYLKEKKKDNNTIKYICGTLKNISEEDKNIDLLMRKDILRFILQYLDEQFTELYCLKIASNISSSTNSEHSKALLNLGFEKQLLPRFLIHPNVDARKECCLILSNLMDDATEIRQHLMTYDLLKSLVKIINTDHPKVVYEALYTVALFITHRDYKKEWEDILLYCICKGILTLKTCLKKDILDANLDALLILLTPENVEKVEETGLVDYLEHLLDHEDKDITGKVKYILYSYFLEEE
jgi:hypothetical protein